MRALSHRQTSQRRFAWLLWLALLLPFAQAAAHWHAMSHVGVSGPSDNDSKQALHLSHCELCLTAAVVAGGALVGEPPVIAPLDAPHAAPAPAAGSAWTALPERPYQSRAPPFAPH